MFVHPALLLWRAQSHPEHIRRNATYHLHHFFIFFRTQWTKGRRARPNYVQPREPGLERFCKALGNARLSSVEKMAVALSRTLSTKCHGQIPAVDASSQRVALAPAQPYEGHAVGHYQVRCVQNVLEGRIMLRFDNTVHAGGCDGVAPVALSNPFLHLRNDFFELHRVGANSQHVECRALESLVERSSPGQFGGLRWFRENCVNGNPEIAKRRTFQARSDPPVGVPKRKRE